LIFEYANDGKGIPEEDLSKIFDPFFTTQRAQGGTGLGLHIRGAIQTSQRIGNGLADTRRKFIR
jgi:signal transduction histidine kinase